MLTNDELKAIEQRAKKCEFLAWADGVTATDDVPALLSDVRALQAEVTRLRNVLVQYADRSFWSRNEYNHIDGTDDLFLRQGHGWKIAQDALKDCVK